MEQLPKTWIGDKLPQTEEELRSWLLSGTAPYAGDFGASADRKKKSIIRNMRQVS